MKYSGRKNIYFEPDFKAGVDFSSSAFGDGKRGADITGFDYSDGSLRTGYGIGACDYAETRCEGMWLYRKYNVPMWAIDGSVKIKREGVISALSGVFVSGRAYGVNFLHQGEEKLLIYSENGGLYLWDGIDSPEMLYGESLGCVEVFSSAIFAADKGSAMLRYTKRGAGFSFTDGGSLDLSDDRGAINRLVAFGEYMYAFKDHGITRVEVKSGSFAAENIYLSGGRIYADTVCLCGDTIVFMTDAGFYKFNGNSISPIMTDVFPLIKPSLDASAAYFEGKYFLACKTESGTVLICYDFDSYTLTKNIGVVALFVMGEKLCCITNIFVGEIVKNGSYFGNPIAKKWTSRVMNFGTSRLKHIRSIFVECNCDVRVWVKADGQERSFYLTPEKKEATVNLRGKSISFGVVTTADEVRISPPVVCYSVI